MQSQTHSTPSLKAADPRRSGHSWLRANFLVMALILMGFTAFAITALASRHSLQQVVRYSTERNNAMAALLLIEQVKGYLAEIDTGQWIYAAASAGGGQELAAPVHQAVLKLRGAHSLLAANLAGSTGEPQTTRALEALVEQRITLANQGITSPLTWNSVQTRQVTVAIIGELGRFKDQLTMLSNSRSQDVTEVLRRTELLSVALPLIGLLLMALAVFQLLYERHRRDAAESALRSMNATLEQQVGQRTEQLQQALTQIKSFASELDRSIEAERRRLSREMHDQFGQVATALRLVVSGLNRSGPAVPEATVQEMLQLVDEAIGMARRISAALRPPLLDDLGLAAAAEHFATTIKRQSGLDIRCDISDDSVLSAHQANQLFRILQEATTNVLRHARATELLIQASAQGSNYRLEVIDNGVGPGSVRADASGLRNMRERAQLIGAELHFGPGYSEGTRVAVLMPTPPPAAGTSTGESPT